MTTPETPLFLSIEQVERETLELIGSIALRHAHLDYILRLTIKSLTGREFKEFLAATERAKSGRLRKRVLSEAAKALCDRDELKKLADLVDRCEKASWERNRLLHNIWVTDPFGKVFIRAEGHSFEAIPAREKLKELAVALTSLANELNDARNTGYLAEALHKRKT